MQQYAINHTVFHTEELEPSEIPESNPKKYNEKYIYFNTYIAI
jgi:hypothetical protein